MFKKYFSLGGKSEEVLTEFILYLYFWGPDFEAIAKLIKYAMESMELEKINNIIKNIKY